MSLVASVFIAASLDGFIAGAGGDLDWVDAANAAVRDGEDFGYHAFIESIDVLVMGRKTFEKVLSFGKWPYGRKQVVILSSKRTDIPDGLAQTVSYSSESPRELCARLLEAGAKRIYVDGGITIQRFLAESLIDDLTITIVPVILGGGIRLFGDLQKDVPLKHVATKTYECGFVQLTYEVARDA